MSVKLDLANGLDVSECDIKDCDDRAVSVWRGLSIEEEDGEVWSFTAAYCGDHAENHAGPHDSIWLIGEVVE